MRTTSYCNFKTSLATILLRWGTGCGSKTRCDNAYNAGYTRCLLYSNDDNMFNIFGSSFVPSALLSNNAGAAIINDVKANIVPVVVISKDTGLFFTNHRWNGIILFFWWALERTQHQTRHWCYWRPGLFHHITTCDDEQWFIHTLCSLLRNFHVYSISSWMCCTANSREEATEPATVDCRRQP